MRLSGGAILVLVAALAACGAGNDEGLVAFSGLAPYAVHQIPKDTREIRTHCPGCCPNVTHKGTFPCPGCITIEGDKQRCPKKKTCGLTMVWAKTYPCGSCQATGACSACRWMEQSKGDCYNCKGNGYLIYQGKTPPCPNCTGKDAGKDAKPGKCPVCKGSAKCDYCNGTGELSRDDVKAKAAKVMARGPEDMDAPPIPRGEEKKPPEKKPEDAKPEEKK